MALPNHLQTPVNVGVLSGDADPVGDCGGYGVFDLKSLSCGIDQALANKTSVSTLANRAWV